MPVHALKTGTTVLIVGQSQVKVAHHGAHVYSWTVDGEEKIFLSSAATSLTGPSAIRGGIPICFPVFGPPPKEEPFGKLKQHGFARTSRWQQRDSSEGEGFVEVRFALEPTDEIKEVFPVPFAASYTVRLAHSPRPSLTTSLTVANPAGGGRLEFQALLHTYLRLPAGSKPVDVKIGGLEGLRFADKVQGGKVEEEQRSEVGFEAGEVDRVYKGVPSSLDVALGNGHSMRIQTSNLPDLTVWNPDREVSDGMADMEKGGWERFVCVEPGQTSFVALGPGETWEGGQVLTPSSGPSKL